MPTFKVDWVQPRLTSIFGLPSSHIQFTTSPALGPFTSTKKTACGFDHATLVMVPVSMILWVKSNSAETEWCANDRDTKAVDIAMNSNVDNLALIGPHRRDSNHINDRPSLVQLKFF